jgi:tubulin-specific chaperone D
MPDVSDVHGGVVALAELARDRTPSIKNTILHNLDASKPLFRLALAPRNAIITEAACSLISTALCEEILATQWMRVLEHGLRHRMETVQIAAAKAVNTMSALEDSSVILSRYV